MWPHPRTPVPLPGSISIEDQGDQRVLVLRGDLDGAVVAAFDAAQRPEPVVVDAIDAAEVTFMSSTGVAVMLLSVEASLAAGRSPVLRAASPVVERLLRMSGIVQGFSVAGRRVVMRGAPGDRSKNLRAGTSLPAIRFARSSGGRCGRRPFRRS